MAIFVSWNNKSGSGVKGRLGPEESKVGTLVKGNYNSPGKNNKDLIS